jgi:putative flippase GtrA
MTLIPPRISDALWRIVPGPLREKLRSNVVKRFVRFAPAAVCAVAATQITYIICIGPANLTAGISGALGWFAGAVVSYVISRWAWERKGRPNVLKETIPFAVVSICAGIILTLASKFGSSVAASMGLHHGIGKVIVADAFYFAANCLTFALRFLIFHFVLFRDRSAGEALAVVEGREPLLAESGSMGIEVPGAEVPSRPAGQADPARVGGAVGSAPVNGAASWGNGNGNGTAGRMPSGEANLDGRVAPDPGRRR